MKNIFIYFPQKQMIKYALVGLSGTVINLAVLYTAVDFFGLFYLLGAGIAFIFAVSNNFFWNKRWTFHDKSHKYKEQYGKYIAVSLMSLVIGLGVLAFFVEIIGLWYMSAQVLTITIVGLNTFLWNKLWTFKR